MSSKDACARSIAAILGAEPKDQLVPLVELLQDASIGAGRRADMQPSQDLDDDQDPKSRIRPWTIILAALAAAFLGLVRCCQSNANQSLIAPELRFFRPPVRATRPVRPSGSLRMWPFVQMAVVVEMVVDRGVRGGELLQGLDVPEAGHRSFSSSERLM